MKKTEQILTVDPMGTLFHLLAIFFILAYSWDKTGTLWGIMKWSSVAILIFIGIAFLSTLLGYGKSYKKMKETVI